MSDKQLDREVSELRHMYREGYKKGAFDALADYKDSLKPELPEVVANFLEEMKKSDVSLLTALDEYFGAFINQNNTKGAVSFELFAKAWLFGYKNEKSPCGVDKPQKIILPKFVADYLKECRLTRNISIGQAIEDVDSQRQKEVFNWLWGENFRNNQLIFASGWLDGYEVKEERKYLLKIPAGRGLYTYYFKGHDGKLISNEKSVDALDIKSIPENYKLTEEQIKEDFEWAWDLGFVEEVKEGVLNVG